MCPGRIMTYIRQQRLELTLTVKKLSTDIGMNIRMLRTLHILQVQKRNPTNNGWIIALGKVEQLEKYYEKIEMKIYQAPTWVKYNSRCFTCSTSCNPHINLRKRVFIPILYRRKWELNLTNPPPTIMHTWWNLSKILKTKIIASVIPFIAIYYSERFSQVYQDIMHSCLHFNVENLEST